jgi:hypothetical protein
VIGVPLDLALFYVIYVIYRQLTSHPREFAVDAAWSANRARQTRSTAARARLRALSQSIDPDFSIPLFQDFCHALYSTVHHARGDRKLDAYSGYLSVEARETLRGLNSSPPQPPARVQGVIIGSCTITEVSPLQPGAPTQIHVQYEANYAEVTPSGFAENWYSRETWVFSRAPGVRSRPP